MRKKILAFLLSLAALLAIAIGAVYWLSAPEAEVRPEERFEDPLEAVLDLKRRGAVQSAYDLAVSSLEVEPQRADLAVESGLLALLLERPRAAHAHMQTAWDLGATDLFVLLTIVDTLDAPPGERIAAFEAGFRKIEQTPENRNARGRFYSRYGHHEKALEIWGALAEASGEEAVYLQMARKLEMIGRRDEAIRLLEERFRLGALSAEGHNLLVSLLVFDNRFADASARVEAIEETDRHGEWDLKKAMFALATGDLPGAADQLELLIDAEGTHPVALTVASEARITFALLRMIEGELGGQLDHLSELSRLESAAFPPRNVTTPILGLRRDPKRVEGERLLYDFFAQLAAGESVGDGVFLRIDSLLGDSPAIRWLGIRQAMLSGRPEDAVALYAALEEQHPLERIEGAAGFFYKSPLFLTEAARAFYQDTKLREALVLLNHLHERGSHAPASIRLFAQIMRERGEEGDVSAMQRALGRQFQNDREIQVALANQAYREGEIDEALETLAPLIEANPADTELRMLELMLLLENGETAAVLEKCGAGDLPKRNQNLVRARVALQTGDVQGAEDHFKMAIDPADFFGFLDYARFLVDQGRHDEALAYYDRLLASQPDNAVALQGKAIIAELRGNPEDAIGYLRRILSRDPGDLYTRTRLAKLELQIGAPRDALRTASKVLATAPENADARYLQFTAMIQLALEQVAPAVQQRQLSEVAQRMDEAFPEMEKNPQFFLYTYLASAYREVGLSGKSGQIYERLLALPGAAWETTPLARDDIVLALEALNE